MRNIIVIGGGIGGLCAALMLEKNGHHVQLFESASEIKAVGAGLGVGSNALQALYAAGVGKQIEEKGTRLDEMIFEDEQGKQLNKMDFTVLAREFGLNNLTIHRADLHHILYKAISPCTIQLNKRCVDFYQDGHEAVVRFADGSTAKADFVIAADGIHSLFRKKLVSDSSPRYAGYTCWRGVVQSDEKQFTGNTSYEIWGKAGRIGIVPLQNDHVYWFACVNAKQDDPHYQNLTPDQVTSIFHAFPEKMTKLLRTTSRENLLHHDMMDIKPVDRFAFGRVILLGDAAHATTPNMGQGAGQAMEDAIVLANCLKQAEHHKYAFYEYEAHRLKRTKKVIQMSRRIGAGAQFENKVAISVRNNLFRLVPSGLLLRQFRYLLDVDLNEVYV